MEGAFWWKEHSNVGGVLVEGVFRWRVGGGVFWCWLKGRFGGASLLMDGGGVLVEGAF